MPRRSILLFAGACIVIAVALAIVTLVVVSGRERAAGGEMAATGQPLVGGDFQLVDQEGRPVDQTILNGKWSLVFFGFTYCPEFCPTTLAEMAAVQQQLGEQARDLQMVFISIDPERDTPEVLKQYVTAFDPRFLGLTGTPDQVKKAAASFKAYYAKAPTKDGNYTMDHTAAFYLLDGKGESRVLANNNIGVDALVHDIQALLKG